MGARAEAAAETHRRIISAALRQFSLRPFDEIALADVARDAAVTVQTVLRRFGSKEGLFEAAAAQGVADVRLARWDAPPGELGSALRGLVEHYEAWGDTSLRLLSQEERVPAIGRVAESGRALHYEWVEHVFGAQLGKARGPARERLRARLIAATDVYTWKIYRRDLGFTAAAVELTLRESVEAIIS
jgi:AcrR family transcriptional regulator